MRQGLIVGVAVLACSVSLFAGQANLSQLGIKSEPVTISFKGAQYIDILQFLGRSQGIEIRLQPGAVATRPPMTVSFRNAKFQDVFDFIVDAAKLNYVVTAEKTVVVSERAVP